MSEIPHEMIPAIGAVIAALIGGAVAYLGLIISKESKVSEFRQQWIDSLREDVSAVISHVEGIRGTSISTLLGQPGSGESLWNTVRDDMTGIKKKSATIRLRLNPNEKRKNEKEANTLILDALKSYKDIFDGPIAGFLEIEGINEQLIAATHTVLKENWDRVRRGERVYKIARRFAFVVIILGIIGAIFLIFRLHP
jgi:hypothetical protein